MLISQTNSKMTSNVLGQKGVKILTSTQLAWPVITLEYYALS